MREPPLPPPAMIAQSVSEATERAEIILARLEDVRRRSKERREGKPDHPPFTELEP